MVTFTQSTVCTEREKGHFLDPTGLQSVVHLFSEVNGVGLLHQKVITDLPAIDLSVQNT
jgi:hypothetical protein